ncbi:MAG: ATP-binding cassette domain-containing protein [Pseudomonadota bacterium]
MLAFEIENLKKVWPGENSFTLSINSLQVKTGERVALVGVSGSGKSTLLDILALSMPPDTANKFFLNSYTRGKVDILKKWDKKAIDQLTCIRKEVMGYILQTGGLFPFLTVRRNISLCNDLVHGRNTFDLEGLAGRLGLVNHLDKLPSQLSVGERQRVAIGRALAHGPDVIIADEPTASLDPITSRNIMQIFTELTDEKGVTVIMATHDWQGADDNGFRQIKFDVKRDTDRGVVAHVQG